MTDPNRSAPSDVPTPDVAPPGSHDLDRSASARLEKDPFTRASFYRYHCYTKHTVAQLMSNAWSLDWDNQPDPFRRYEGATVVPLPRDLSVSREDTFDVLRRCQEPELREAHERPPEPAGLRFLSELFFYSLALSAWKEIAGTEHRWSLRVNPSSGNLHPTEAHLLCRDLPDLSAGVYHYAPREHALEARAAGDVVDDSWQLVSADDDPAPPVLMVLTSVFWREAWKYRHRAYRYCNHDVGHAAAALLVSAAALGWRGEIHGRFADVELERALGLSGSDERPLTIVALRPSYRSITGRPRHDPTRTAEFRGVPNVPSPEVIPYHAIDDVHAAGALTLPAAHVTLPRLPSTASRPSFLKPVAAPIVMNGVDAKSKTGAGRPIHSVVRRRRSAVDHDGIASMSLAEFMLVLSTATRGVPADFLRGTMPDAHFLVHLYAYVHRVRDLHAGLYYYDRVSEALTPLSLEDERNAASGLSLGQDIASAACFALSMVADLGTAFAIHGDRGYRFVHHEAGAIGQLLYLGAEALGFQATGIGAFFDDDVNRHLGLGAGFEVVYHFCVGRAVDDPRLTTRPAYDFPDPALST
ncbi:MAG: SagB/ThcOx family dehydrogenase [Planctomycetes bacterium]|nr:SagB/ThcOx family dehydrogenase [Planctomycetota bacterium]